MAEDSVVLKDGKPVGFSEKEDPGMTEDMKSKFQWCSKPCLNVASVRPLPRNGNAETSLSHPQSPSPSLASSVSPARSTTSEDSDFLPQIRLMHLPRRNCTRPSPFSFDSRDSVQRVAHERKLEELRLMEESHMAFTFKANPVRKYKPLVLKQSIRPLTVPQWPFSRPDK
ncbi:siaz-interacting nuclear protein isoform X2 [Neoarius graeffei]|uniref:siaz-interacting nuclear protein isoform X2 n=1 Tax=Neoarius graeffei TaxID=443677 RepID=UPI00298CDFD9|nr:siaz-interacting nuclear protein isoform X2 [Neoarius graeffei]